MLILKLSSLFSSTFRQVPTFKQKIAGKSPPTEKFAIRKARRYKASSPVRLPVPVLVKLHTQHPQRGGNDLFGDTSTVFPSLLQEMMYMWNGFSMISKRLELTEGMLQTLVEAKRALQESPSNVASSK